MTGLAVASSRKATEAFGEHDIRRKRSQLLRPEVEEAGRESDDIAVLLGVRSRAESLMSSTTAVNSLGKIE